MLACEIERERRIEREKDRKTYIRIESLTHDAKETDRKTYTEAYKYTKK